MEIGVLHSLNLDWLISIYRGLPNKFLPEVLPNVPAFKYSLCQ
jgi:hypothetical protein